MPLSWTPGPNGSPHAIAADINWTFWICGPSRAGEPWKAGRDRWVGDEYTGKQFGFGESEAEAIAACEAEYLRLLNEWNPRYLAYCTAQGRGPEEQTAFDKERWPGGCMCGYMQWIAERKAALREAHPEVMYRDMEGNITLNIWDLDAWDRWLGVKA